MKTIVFFAILILVASCANERILFQHFKTKFNKQYSVEEEAKRFKNFQTNLKKIQEHNAGDHTYKMGINQFADLTETEWRKIYLKPIQNMEKGEKLQNSKLPKDTPTSWNWVDHGAVTAVKDQGQCGSCWAFSVTGTIEGCVVAQEKGGELISLSEQEIVDCDDGSGGCNGGSQSQAMEWVIKNGGLCSEQDYAYTGVDGTCHKDKCNSVSTLTGDQQISDEKKFADTCYEYGPFAVGVDASGFEFYSGGIYDGAGCGTQLNHAVLLVGWNFDGETPYWIVKNSWGTSWGMNGYIWMKEGINICGISDYAFYGTGCHNV
ncbi:cysteine proteinase [Anaeramoeba ignava]|uniref:Cysteine proteinase n=1 Tax=Anaeramoeba ignava TaxID=1746090 RepID=A0A9Q0LRA9_ANAIG|nr:cysteine proteinase [Anaeramoeba ignava]